MSTKLLKGLRFQTKKDESTPKNQRMSPTNGTISNWTFLLPTLNVRGIYLFSAGWKCSKLFVCVSAALYWLAGWCGKFVGWSSWIHYLWRNLKITQADQYIIQFYSNFLHDFEITVSSKIYKKPSNVVDKLSESFKVWVQFPLWYTLPAPSKKKWRIATKRDGPCKTYFLSNIMFV